MPLKDKAQPKKVYKKKVFSDDFLLKAQKEIDLLDVRDYVDDNTIKNLLKTVVQAGEQPSGIKSATFILEHVLEARSKSRRIKIKFPIEKIKNIEDVETAQNWVFQSMSNGYISPEEANQINSFIESKKDTIVKRDLIERYEKVDEVLSRAKD